MWKIQHKDYSIFNQLCPGSYPCIIDLTVKQASSFIKYTLVRQKKPHSLQKLNASFIPPIKLACSDSDHKYYWYQPQKSHNTNVEFYFSAPFLMILKRLWTSLALIAARQAFTTWVLYLPTETNRTKFKRNNYLISIIRVLYEIQFESVVL